jgi:hypothetical protein
MPTPKSQADIIAHLEGLLEAAERSPDLRLLIETERQPLAESLGLIKGLKARQEQLGALRQEVTQQLGVALVEAMERAIVFRSVVRGKVGPRSERLVHFKTAPLRKRPRKKKVAEKPPLQEEAVNP